MWHANEPDMMAPKMRPPRPLGLPAQRGHTPPIAAVMSQCRHVAHGVDAVAVGLAMEVVARVAERKLLSAAAHQPSDVGHDESSVFLSSEQ